MKRSSAPLLLCAALMTTGCSKLYADITGNVDGNKLGAGTAYWGGPVLLFTDSDMACDQLSWVSYRPSGTGYEDGEDLGTDENFTALQITYESDVLRDGKVTMAANTRSGAQAYFMVADGGIIDLYKAGSGSIFQIFWLETCKILPRPQNGVIVNPSPKRANFDRNWDVEAGGISKTRQNTM